MNYIKLSFILLAIIFCILGVVKIIRRRKLDLPAISFILAVIIFILAYIPSDIPSISDDKNNSEAVLTSISTQID